MTSNLVFMPDGERASIFGSGRHAEDVIMNALSRHDLLQFLASSSSCLQAVKRHRLSLLSTDTTYMQHDLTDIISFLYILDKQACSPDKFRALPAAAPAAASAACSRAWRVCTLAL